MGSVLRKDVESNLTGLFVGLVRILAGRLLLSPRFDLASAAALDGAAPSSGPAGHLPSGGKDWILPFAPPGERRPKGG